MLQLGGCDRLMVVLFTSVDCEQAGDILVAPLIISITGLIQICLFYKWLLHRCYLAADTLPHSHMPSADHQAVCTGIERKLD